MDDSRLEVIKKMETPTDKKGVKRLLGVITYCAKFIPKLSNLTEPLRKLIKKDVEFNWSNEQEVAFNKIKKSLTDSPILKFYDPNLPCTLSVDASISGVGAVCSKKFCLCVKSI